MKKREQYRQGDVLIERVAKVPAGLKPVAREAGRIVLAHGEVTGHAHAIAEPECELLETGDERFLRVIGREIPALRCRNVVTSLACWIPMGYDVATYKNLVLEGPEVVEGVVLRHEEHNPYVIPRGDHRVTRQREYSPEAIRSVAD